MEALGCLPPTLEPKATDHVSDMVSTIEQIISNGHGYAVDGDVFFDVASLPGYGRLSGRAQVWLTLTLPTLLCTSPSYPVVYFPFSPCCVLTLLALHVWTSARKQLFLLKHVQTLVVAIMSCRHARVVV